MNYVVGLLIGAAIAYYIYGDSQKRGMNATLWAVLGFLFGLITLIIYLIVRKPVQNS